MSVEKKFVFISLFLIYSTVVRELLLSQTQNGMLLEFERSGEDILQETAQKYTELSQIPKEELPVRVTSQVLFLNTSFHKICKAFRSPKFKGVPGCRSTGPCKMAENFDILLTRGLFVQVSLELMFDYTSHVIPGLFNLPNIDGTRVAHFLA